MYLREYGFKLWVAATNSSVTLAINFILIYFIFVKNTPTLQLILLFQTIHLFNIMLIPIAFWHIAKGKNKDYPIIMGYLVTKLPNIKPFC